MPNNRRTFIKTAALSAAGLSTLAHSAQTAQEPPRKPNIVLLFADDMGMGDVSCYGHSEIPTPHIDSIAHDGTRFTDFYVAAPVCTPSRFSLLTGMMPNRSADKIRGAFMFAGENDKDRGIRPHEITLASQFKSIGYDTAIIGKWHLGHGSRVFHGTAFTFRTPAAVSNIINSGTETCLTGTKAKRKSVVMGMQQT